MAQQRAPLTVTIDSGVVRGYSIPSTASDRAVVRWQAIPYRDASCATTSDFAPPRPVAPFGELDCGLSRQPSDATLSVCSPPLSSDANRPVIVFVHGGRFEEGSGDQKWYHGQNFARDGAVFVSINYRKRFSGFLPIAGEPLPEDFPRDHAGHLARPYFRGAEDVLCALRWVQRNIAAFSGDPENVTMVGQSAGGALTAWTLCDPRAEGLVHRAVILSMAWPRENWQGRLGHAERYLGTPLDWEHMRHVTNDHAEAAYTKFAHRYRDDCAVGPDPFQPELMASVPLLIGTMRDEFVQMPVAKRVDRMARGKNPVMRLASALLHRRSAEMLGIPGTHMWTDALSGRKHKNEWLRQWFAYNQEFTPPRPLGRAIGEGAVRRWNVAAMEQRAGAGSQAGAHTWAYEFHGGLGDTEENGTDAQHCGDLPLLFNVLDQEPAAVAGFCGPNAPDRLQPLADRFHGIVSAFARGESPDWPEYQALRGRRPVKLFDMSDSSESLGEDSYASIRRLFPRMYP